jgi:hypothetical protein
VISVGEVMADAGALYRLLWQRGMAISLPVFAVIGIGNVLATRSEGGGGDFAVLILGIIGPVFVQAFLVEAVRNAHEGKVQESIGTLYERAGAMFLPLLMSTLVYGIGVAVGIFLIIVPGLILLSRWSLFVPLMVIDGLRGSEARKRSNQLVKGKTVTVLLAILLVYVLALVPGILLQLAVGAESVGGIVVGTLWAGIVAPFQAHVLTAIYYRLTDESRPVVHASLLR